MTSSPDLLVATELTLRKGGKQLLDAVSLRIAGGETVALVGPNGSGKTTLLRCLIGLERSDAGSVMLEGRSLARLTARERAASIALLAQHNAMDEAITVLEYVTTARYRWDETRASATEHAERALEEVGALEHARQLLPTLSGGERQRVALAALIAQDARIQLLDEPANHLDPARQAQSYALLGRMQQRRSSLVIVTHDINLLSYLHWPDRVRVVGMSGGKVAFEERYDDPRLVGELADLYGVPMQRVQSQGHSFILPELDAARIGNS